MWIYEKKVSYLTYTFKFTYTYKQKNSDTGEKSSTAVFIISFSTFF